jgi:ribose transport system substrate-binding protein
MRLRLITFALPLCIATVLGCTSRTPESTTASIPTTSGGGVQTETQPDSSNESGFPRKAGLYTVLGILTDNQDNNKAKENAETTLIRHPQVGCLVGLWSQNTPMILAALRSSNAVGKVKVVGFDEHPETLAGIREGIVFGTIVQQPYAFGYRSVEWLTTLALGKEVDVPESGLLYIPHQSITGKNVQKFADDVQAIRAGKGPLLSPDLMLDGKGKRVAYITNSTDPFWTLAEFGCNRAAEQFGCEVDVQMPSSGTIEEQKRYLESNVAQKLDGIAISPIDPENQVGMINEAAKATILICHDSDAPASSRRFYLGTSNYMAGRAAGKLIKQALPDGGEVMLFVGKMEVLNAQERSQGIIDELSGEPVPEYLSE